MREIDDILNLDFNNFTFGDLLKFQLMLQTLDSKIEKKQNTSFETDINLKETCRRYQIIMDAVYGIWNKSHNITGEYFHLRQVVSRAIDNTNPAKLLNMNLKHNEKVDITHWIHEIDNFILALTKFNKSYDKMQNISVKEQSEILEKYIKLPKMNVNRYVLVVSNAYNSRGEVAVFTKDSIGITAKKFYLDNWGIVTSESDYTKLQLKSSYTSVAKHFYPEDYL